MEVLCRLPAAMHMPRLTHILRPWLPLQVPSVSVDAMTASLTLCPGQPPAPALQSFSADLLLTDHPMTLTGAV